MVIIRECFCRHGVNQLRYPWSDGPEYITQCPIQPGEKFSQKLILSTEEGTIWWHAHSNWTRATVYGAIFVYPKPGTTYPFPQPDAEVPIILGTETNKKLYLELIQCYFIYSPTVFHNEFDEIYHLILLIIRRVVEARHNGCL